MWLFIIVGKTVRRIGFRVKGFTVWSLVLTVVGQHLDISGNVTKAVEYLDQV